MPVPRAFFKLQPRRQRRSSSTFFTIWWTKCSSGASRRSANRRWRASVYHAGDSGDLRFCRTGQHGGAAIGAVANIVLDAALICGFHLGVQGAALAAVLSQGMSASFVIRYLCTDRSVLRLRLRNIRFSGKLLWPCILLGTSPALMQLTENLVAISFNISLQAYGGDMAVLHEHSEQRHAVCDLLLPGLVQGAQPLLSYNPAQRISRGSSEHFVCCSSAVSAVHFSSGSCA